MPKHTEQAVITFKADRELARTLRRQPNRSDFIRSALQAALTRECPFCAGRGRLTREQERAWRRFQDRHTLAYCPDCGENHWRCIAPHRAIRRKRP